jgi:hypothetical protein
MRNKYVTTCLILLVACLGVALLCLVYPIYVIRPFRPQGTRELAIALNVLQYRGLATMLSSAVALIALICYWRSRPRLREKIFVAIAFVCICLCAALSRVNVYERMFHPVGTPAFESAHETKLDGSEKILGVRVNGAARAYPVRSIAYHHVVNDTVGGLPLVATY